MNVKALTWHQAVLSQSHGQMARSLVDLGSLHLVSHPAMYISLVKVLQSSFKETDIGLGNPIPILILNSWSCPLAGRPQDIFANLIRLYCND